MPVGQDGWPPLLEVDRADRTVLEDSRLVTAELACEFDLEPNALRRGNHAGVGLEDDVGVIGDFEDG